MRPGDAGLRFRAAWQRIDSRLTFGGGIVPVKPARVPGVVGKSVEPPSWAPLPLGHSEEGTGFAQAWCRELDQLFSFGKLSRNLSIMCS